MRGGRQGLMVDASPVVLVVEDDPLLLGVLCELLDLHGFRSVGTAAPEQALTIASTEHPAVFLIDLMLPDRSGVDLARHLRGRGFSRTPMIAMSVASAMLREADRPRLFQGMLWKPFDVTALIECIKRVHRGV